MPPVVDLSWPLSATTPTFPGDPPLRLEAIRTLERGDPYRLSTIAMGSHAGTHLDAPSHFVSNGVSVDRVDLDRLNGPTLVVQVPEDRAAVDAAAVAAVPYGTARVLFRTTNSERWRSSPSFFPDYVALLPGAADALLARGVRLVGVDALSVEND